MFEHFPRLLETYLVKGIVAGVTAAAYGVVAEATDDVVENASNMQEVPAVNDVIVLRMIPKQDSQHKRGSCCR
jgi:hypothetical protein